MQIIVYFLKLSKYSSSKEGEFFATSWADENMMVYKGKPLTLEEFNNLPAEVFERGRYSQPVRVKIQVIKK